MQAIKNQRVWIFAGPSAAMVLLCLAAGASVAAIPQPDVLLYGTVTIDGQPVTANDDVTIVARAKGATNPVGRYKMGGLASAGDRYVLRLRLETVVPNTTLSADAVAFAPGQTAVVQILAQQGTGPETLLEEYTITAQGAIVELNLPSGGGTLKGDSDGDGDIDLQDYQSHNGCFTGMCSAPPCLPALYAAPSCSVQDFDDDGDVDVLDFGQFQLSFTGSQD